MKLLFALILSSAAFLAAQDKNEMNREHAKDFQGQITVQGCVSRSGGDYILMKQHPEMTYELHGTGKVKLRHYLGQWVEVVGSEAPSMSTSSDAMNKTGSAASSTISVVSIRTISQACTVR